jgi:hypothetical protein
LGRRGEDEFLAKIAAHDPRAASLSEDRDPPPDLLPGAGLFLDAFNALRHDRTYTDMGVPLPIHWTVRHAYAGSIDFPPDELPLFHRLLTALDGVYCAVTAERIERDRENRTADNRG